MERNKLRSWCLLGGLTVIFIYLHIFMEWLFFVTEPSFLSGMELYENLLILTVTPLVPVLIALGVIFILWILSKFAKIYQHEGIFIAMARIIPAFILTIIFLILIDNFTYTLFTLGIQSTGGFWRLVYGVLVLVVFLHVYRMVLKIENNQYLRFKLNYFLYSVGVLLTLSSGGTVLAYFSADSFLLENTHLTKNPTKRPNILFIGSDGVNADHMSVYGYHRNTTPFIQDFSKKALVFDNSFPNTSSSGGSIAAMLTGKLATQTRVIYPPDILKGKDAYQHLPGIFRMLGYRSIDFGTRYYADTFDLNMRNSFDSANYREAKDFKLRNLSDYLGFHVFDPEIYFFGRVYERIERRLLHLSGARKMIDHYREIRKLKKLPDLDIGTKPQDLMQFINQSEKPFFAHIHLMGTHGPRFYTKNLMFSFGKEQTDDWMDDFYDDALLEFDKIVEKVIGDLERNNKLKNTIVIINSDHGMKWSAHVRVPLIIYFPDESSVGRVPFNVQHIDIGPTILDYLGMEIPEWMAGESLLSPGINRLRPIISVNVGKIERLITGIQEKMNSPPFYGIRMISAEICHKSYQLNLIKNKFSVVDIVGHTVPCNNSEMPDEVDVRGFLVTHLRENGYDISSLLRP